MTLLNFDNPVFRYYAVAAALIIIKLMSQGWITVFRMMKVNAGLRYPEDARKSPVNPNPGPDQLLPNEYVERSRRMHGNDVENIPLFLAAGLLYVCTSPGAALAAGLYAAYVLSRLGHFIIVLMHRSHEARAFFWTIGSAIVYFMAGATLWAAARGWSGA
jgi:glutathione S-transferase